MKIFAQREIYSDTIEIRMRHDDRIAQPVVFTVTPPNSYAPPALLLPNDDAQRLMDELWNCGLRPSEGSGSAGSLAATERHLADMRSMAFHALKVPK